MELRVLRYFLRVAREGSLTRAARFLHVTQPTLSRQLKDLEEELGQKLFTRSNYSISLTPEGRLLRKRAEEIMDMVEKTESEFCAMGEVVSGDVHIGGGETAAMGQIACAVKELREEYPQIRYHIYSGNAEDVTERLDKGMLDFGILIQPVDLSKYNYIHLPDTDVWGVVMKSASPLAGKEFVTRQDLLHLPLICSSQVLRKTSGENKFAEWFEEDWDKLNVTATYNLLYNAALMVREGVGYALSLDKILNVVDGSGLCFRPLEPRLESGLSVVWKKYQVFSAAAEVFLEKLQEKLSVSSRNFSRQG